MMQRTTISMKPQIASQVYEYAKRKKMSVSSVINELLGIAIGIEKQEGPERASYEIRTFRSGFLTGVDPDRLKDALYEMDIEEYQVGHPRR